MEEIKQIRPEDLNHYMEGKSVAEAYFSNGGGLLPTAAKKGASHYDPVQDPDRLIIRLRDKQGHFSEVRIMLSETLEGKPILETFIEEMPQYFDRE